jgi:hypothetical protein
VGAQRPGGALPGAEGRQHERRAEHRRRGEGRSHGLHREGRRSAHPGVLPRRRGAGGRSRRAQRRSSARRSRDGSLPAADDVQVAAGRGRLTSSRGPTTTRTTHRSRQRRGRRPGRARPEQERHGAAGRGRTVRHGGRQARAGVVAAEQPAGVRGRDAPATAPRRPNAPGAGAGGPACACRPAARGRGRRAARASPVPGGAAAHAGGAGRAGSPTGGTGASRARAVRRRDRAALPGAGAGRTVAQQVGQCPRPSRAVRSSAAAVRHRLRSSSRFATLRQPAVLRTPHRLPARLPGGRRT